MALIATVAPRSQARSAARTTSPDGAKVIAASSGSGGVSPVPPVHSAPSARARSCSDGERVATKIRQPQCRAIWSVISAEAVQPEPAARLDGAALERSIPDHAAAQQRRRREIVEPVGEAQREVGARDRVRRVAAVDVPAGERGVRAQVLAPGPALVAGAVAARQPGHARPIADVPVADAGSDGLDAPDDLVAGDDRPLAHRQIALAQLQVRAADAARGDTQQEHPLGGRGRFTRDGAKGSGRRGRRVLEHHGAG